MPTVDDLATRLWDALLAASPLWASSIGDHRHAALLPALDADAEAAHIAALRAIDRDAAAVSAEDVSDDERVTLAVVRAEATAQADYLASGFREIEVAPALVGPQNHLYEHAPALTFPTAEEAHGLLARYRATDGWFANASRRLDEGLAAGRSPTARAVRGTIQQLDTLLSGPIAGDPLLRAADPSELSATAATTWRQELHDAVRDVVRPALRSYRDHLERVVAPHARPDDRVGLAWLDGGETAYAAAVRRFTSLDLQPDELHSIGLDEVERLAGEYAELGGRALGTSDVAAIFGQLREDPSLRFTTSEQVLAQAEIALGRAQAGVPKVFGRLPQAACTVVPMEPHEVEHGTIAYYLPPAQDGSRAGGYHVNTAHPGTRTRFESEALAFHESVPGHHLQIAIAQELDHLPPLRRHLLDNAYVEGWALYSERLADELDLYTGDLERLGMLSLDSWRASRLVVDTGLHSAGWSRQQAIDYLLTHSPQAPNNIVNEVDRYIAWPGQALGYKVGQRMIFALRRRAEAALGPAFDLSAFHDTILGSGALPLAVLEGVVDRWILGTMR